MVARPEASAQPTEAEKLLGRAPLNAWVEALPDPWRVELARMARGGISPAEPFEVETSGLLGTLGALERETRENPRAYLKCALTLAASDVAFWSDVTKALGDYREAVNSDVRVLHPAWLLACALEVSPATPGPSMVPLGQALLKLYDALREPDATDLRAHFESILAPVTAPITQGKSPPSPTDEWAKLAPSLITTWQTKLQTPMNELMGLIGVPKVKRRVLELIAAERTQTTLPPASRIPQTLNFALLGNPGTGKTTVARLIGRILHAVGLRASEKFEEVTARKLMNGSLDDFHALLDKCEGGVLFIDEAYALDPKQHERGRAIFEELLVAAETRRDRLSIILAGYQREMEQKLFAYNEGLQSRLERVVLDDFTQDELNDVWCLELGRRAGWTQESHEVGHVVARRLARRSGARGFGNARDVRREFERVARTTLARLSETTVDAVPTPQVQLVDVVGAPPSSETHPELKRVLNEVGALTGQKLVKQAFAQLVETAAQNHNRELRGDKPMSVSLNRLFLGNPGTGKTTTARLYGRLLRALGFLSDGEVLVRGASDLVGSHVGESQQKTKALIELARGKVLLIDEAYALNDSLYGKQALDTLVEHVHGAPGEDIAIVMCGYVREMDEMLRSQNPGLSRRFPRDQALMFEDFTDDELMLIAVKKAQQEDLRLPAVYARRLALELGRKRAVPHFGNAGEVEQRLSTAKQRCASRKSDHLSESDLFGDAPTSSPLHELRALGVDEATLAHFVRFEALMQVHARDGGSKPLIGHLQFIGNAGTGKTSVARLMGRFFHSMGVLARDHVEETSGLDLTGAFVGQTKDVVQKHLEAAAGGILFVDEAYQLAEGQYGAEAVTTLVQLMTEPRYDRDKTLIILAGYSGPMTVLMRSNQGLASRFKHRVEFEDWSPERCTELFKRLARDERLEFSESTASVAAEGFEELARLPHWANARDVRTLFDDARGERAVRVLAEPERTPLLSEQDLRGALERLLASRRAMTSAASEGNNRETHPVRGPRAVISSPAALQPVASRPLLHRDVNEGRGSEPGPPEGAGLESEESLLMEFQRELQEGADRLKGMKKLSKEDAGEDSFEAALERRLSDDPNLIADFSARGLDHPTVQAAMEDVIARWQAKGVSPDEAQRTVESEVRALWEHARDARKIMERLKKDLPHRIPVYKCGYCDRPWGTGRGQCTYMGPILVGWETAKNV